MTKIVRLADKTTYSSKANLKNVEIGKWFKFSVMCVGESLIGYGKVVNILDNGQVEVDNYFELPSYRPFASTKWYDNLPFAI